MIRYQNGDLSNREMHQVERLLLDSDFDAEAMEGAGSISADEFSEDLTTLNRRLEERTRTAGGSGSSSLSWWWAAAASVLILVTAGIFFFDQPSPEKQIAMKNSTPSAPSADEAPESDLTKREESVAGDLAESEIPEKVAEETPQEEQTDPIAMAENEEKTAANVSSKERRSSAEPQTAFEETEALSVDEAPELAELPRMEADSSPDITLPQSMIYPPEQEMVGVIKGEDFDMITPSAGGKFEQIHGRVINRTGEPVAGAFITLSGSDKAIISDRAGEFDLRLSDFQEDETIVSMVGLKMREMSISENDSLTIILEDEEADLGEVVVKDGNAPMKNVIYRGAGPSGGLEAFENYIGENLKDALKDSIPAEVTVLFTVFVDGSLGEFKVRRSPGQEYSTEAVRLIRQGPAWLPALEDGVPVKDRVRVKIPFGED